MNLHVDPHAPLPIYAQIVDQIRGLIVQRQLLGEQALPSVRSLAEQLEINSLTVQKAYKQLESDGLIQIRKGVGATVAISALETLAKTMSWNPRQDLRPIVNQAKNLGHKKEELQKHIDELWKES